VACFDALVTDHPEIGGSEPDGRASRGDGRSGDTDVDTLVMG
jgi:hypothetical protein